ncbi:MAG: NADH-quinone oxidoreductase subunit J [Desulfobacterales bacterium]|jgi:NADH-quinone oxidoreductase subunit J|nr:NADH-quinone oxidoreductase subunit J [Desulfobacterales bacterium]
MTLYSIIFYILGLEILVTTVLAVSRHDMVHAVIYLIMSFFGSALLFFLLGAPFLGALEVIIYAGAIMILFLFIVMMLNMKKTGKPDFPSTQWVPAAALSLCVLMLIGLLAFIDPSNHVPLESAMASPKAFGEFLFRQHWLSIEIISLLLLVALIGALALGRQAPGEPRKEESETPS